MPDWACPDCGQRFTRRNASHSCAVQDVEAFFEGYPEGMPIFHAVRKALAELGPVEAAATRTQVSFRARTRFAWLWIPAKALKNGARDVYLTMDLPRRLASKRVREAVETRPGRWTHHVKVDGPAAIDGEVRGWLREAYGMGSVERTRRP